MSGENAVCSLDNVVTEWAWEWYCSTLRCPKIFLKSLYKLQISWLNVTTTQDKVTYDPPMSDSEEATHSPKSEPENNDKSAPSPHSEIASASEATPPAENVTASDGPTSTPCDATHTILLTTFENDSEESQQYTLDVQHTVRNTWKVEVTECVTQEGTCSFTLEAPFGMINAGATYSLRKEVTDVKEQTFENEVTWSGSCQVIVKPKTRSNAKAVSTTRCVVRDFSLHKFFKGSVSVWLKPRLGNSVLHPTHSDIADILCHKSRPTNVRFSRTSKGCKTTIRGSCTFEYSAEQNIRIFQESLSQPDTNGSKLEPVPQKPSTKSDTNLQLTYVKA